MFIEIHGIKKAFGQGDSRVQVLKGIDLELERGEFCVLLGPSGSGKSTLLNIIGGIDTADSGEICIGGEHRSSMREKQHIKNILFFIVSNSIHLFNFGA